MRRGLGGTAVLLAALAVVMIVALPASAKSGNSKVGLSIGYDPPAQGGATYFIGIIRSGRQACISGRKITIYRTINPGKRAVFKSGRTDSKGGYRIPLNATMPTAGYFASASAKQGCLAERSGLIAVGQSQLGVRPSTPRS